jgi:threonine dehydrogenase-like Zn-dependent dehydrogenase
MHLFAGAIIELQGGDMYAFSLALLITPIANSPPCSSFFLCSLGHECMGIVESVGPEVTKLKVGDRVVAGFNIGCGGASFSPPLSFPFLQADQFSFVECFMCEQKLSSACTKTNNSALMNTMYGGRTCGMVSFTFSFALFTCRY